MQKRSTLDIVAVGRHVRATNQRRRALRLVGGAALLALATTQRGVVGAILAVGGLALVVRGATGRSLLESLQRFERALATRLKSVTNARPDRVDEASLESFPASDPPAHSPAKS